MSCRNVGAFVITVLSVTAMAACARESPLAPSASPPGVSSQSADAAPASVSSHGAAVQAVVTGTYEIFFLKETRQGLQPVEDFTLNVGEALVLGSRVRDTSGVLATEGTVTYEYCERQNVKVPSAECVSGRARWRRHMSMSVDPIGSLAFFGSCSTPRTIGFRVSFNGTHTHIASGVGGPRDVSWQ
jgi:hypothetical protein